MQKENVRVIVASEYPEVRNLLNELARREPGAVVVGQAENGIKATSLARRLRPDVAMLDCHLPHTVGADTIPLSRVSGLDAALVISHEVRNTRVILLSNLDSDVFREQGLNLALGAYLSNQSAGATSSLTLREVSNKTLHPGAVVFANVEAREQKSLSQRVIEGSDKAIPLGGLAIFGGLCLILTMVFAPVGIVLASAGAAALLLGVAGKVATSMWSRVSFARGERRAETEQESKVDSSSGLAS